MSAIWTIVRKELRLLVRDRVATVLLLGMPLVFILVLGLLLGEGFGQPSDDRLRISIVVEPDKGDGLKPGLPWSRVVEQDLAETAGIRVEIIDSADEAERLIREHRRAAVVIFTSTFSESINRCSFLNEGLNPFFREGVRLIDPEHPQYEHVDARLLKDSKQPGTAAIIEQVTQVSLMRVILPWMIGRAFDKLSDPSFLSELAREAQIPQFLLTEDFKVRMGRGIKVALQRLFSKYNLRGKTWGDLTRPLGPSVLVSQVVAAQGLNSAGTWGCAFPSTVAALGVAVTDTSSFAGPASESVSGSGKVTRYENREGSGLLSRGAQRYQVLVPAYTVMFAFFLVLVVGGVFVTERRQGTLKRLRAAPLAGWQVLLGKLLPCFVLSVGQGVFLLLAGRLLFGLRWGPPSWPWWQQAAWLLPVVLATSLAAMGLALLVAALARTEIQVAIYGALPVLVLSLVGGCVLPRELMPEQTQALALLTPQGWALEAYRELLGATAQNLPDLSTVLHACGVLGAFGAGFLALAWGLLRLD
jgi:ABC-type multidrug transport system permease subunit